MTKKDGLVSASESPIEAMLLSALADVSDAEGSTLTIITQANVGPYRVDIAISDTKSMVLIVECDGHDFHDRTKIQAARDRKRDRDILYMTGVVTVRFTGSEIFADAEECARYCICLAGQMSYLQSLSDIGTSAIEARQTAVAS